MLCRVHLLVIALMAAPFGASLSETIPTETFFKPNEFDNVRMSPDGMYIAAIARTPAAPDARNIIVMDLETNSVNVITDYKDDDVRDFWWVTAERLVFRLYDDFDSSVRYPDYIGTFAINRNGKKGAMLHRPYESDRRSIAQQDVRRAGGFFQWLDLVDIWYENPDYFIAEKMDQRARFPDIYKVNIHNGHMRKLETNDADIYSWVADHEGRPRAGHSTGKTRDDLWMSGIFKASEDSDWTEVVSEISGDFTLHAFDQDNEHLFVSARANSDKLGFYRIDPAMPELTKPLITDAIYDVDGRLVSSRNGKPLFVRYHTDKIKKLFFDADWADRQASIDAALPDTVNDFVGWNDDENRFLIYSWSDRNVGDYYLYDEAAGKLQFVLSRASWLKPDDMAPMMPIEFEARDGLQIHGYLTLPVNAGDGPYPMVVHPHGGPYGIRDRWGFNRDVQFLANRGYAVLQVNFRGSGGYGQSFEHDAHKKWGLEMQDDITDAVEWTIDQGYVDKDRVCIYGASYGGYATLMGLIKTPDQYRCGINYVGVSDLAELYQYIKEETNVAGDAAIGKEWFSWAVGNPNEDKERFYETSPINHVDKIQSPLLVVHGVDDWIVPIIHSRRLVRKLRAENKVHEYYEKRYEGHGFFTPDNEIDLYNTIEEFLTKYNN